jgi:hypothetical protein
MEALKNTEKREKARLMNMVGDEIHTELVNGKNATEVLHDIPKHFKLRLHPERKPPGKIMF